MKATSARRGAPALPRPNNFSPPCALPSNVGSQVSTQNKPIMNPFAQSPANGRKRSSTLTPISAGKAVFSGQSQTTCNTLPNNNNVDINNDNNDNNNNNNNNEKNGYNSIVDFINNNDGNNLNGLTNGDNNDNNINYNGLTNGDNFNNNNNNNNNKNVNNGNGTNINNPDLMMNTNLTRSAKNFGGIPNPQMTHSFIKTTKMSKENKTGVNTNSSNLGRFPITAISNANANSSNANNNNNNNNLSSFSKSFGSGMKKLAVLSSIKKRSESISKNTLFGNATSHSRFVLANQSSNNNSSQINIKDKIIRIQIFSNWGHPDTVSCSEIDLLGKDRKPIIVKKVLIEPMNHISVNLALLHNGDMIKCQKEDSWYAEWPPKHPLTSICLIYKVSPNIEIDSMRIWPTPFNLEMNIKGITVFIDDDQVFQGDLPNNFGKVIPLSKPEIEETEKETLKMIQNMKNDKKFKIDLKTSLRYPLIPIQNLKISCFDTYECKTHFGFARIRIFDSYGEPIDVRSVAAIMEENCGEKCPPAAVLFHELMNYCSINNNNTVNNDNNNNNNNNDKNNNKAIEEDNFIHLTVWKGELKAPSSGVLVHFTEPTIVSAVILYTFRHPKEMSVVDISARKVRVYVEKEEIWTGRLRHTALPEDDEHAREDDCATIVFLMEDEEVQKNVLRNAFPGKKCFGSPGGRAKQRM